ncbi:MAG: DNA primase [Ruminococcus sp.]|nr:DNA primase [Ruminococcus sp.]
MSQHDCIDERPSWYDGKTVNEVLFCKDFLQKHPMVRVGGSFFTKEGRVSDEESVRKEIYDMLRPFLNGGLTRRASNLLEMLKLEAYTANLPVHEDRLHVANGTLFLDGTFTEEKDFCRNRLPVSYNLDAPQPVTWLHFLSELLEDEDILTLQEYLGYCLIPTTRGQTMMLLKGNGGEGKSRIGVVMQKMLGDNLKNGSIAKIEHSAFARADLEHQLLMVDDDMKMEALKSTHYLKSLITAEMPMDLERKGEQSYQGEMYVRFLAFSNGDLESLYDHSDGFYRRQLILSVKKRPRDREDDPFLADKLCSEIEGIFLWCLDGLRRLIANNYRFTESERARENRAEAKCDANNVLLFLRSEGYIRLKADYTIPSAELYTIYTMWCDDNAYKPLALRTVSMTLKKYASEFGLEHDNHVLNRAGKRVNGFWGIEALVTPPCF